MEMNTNVEKLIDVLRAHKNDLTLPEDIYNAMTAYFSEEKKETEYLLDIRLIPRDKLPYNHLFEKHFKISASDEVKLAKELFKHTRPFLLDSNLKIIAILMYPSLHSICMERANSGDITTSIIRHEDLPDPIYALDIEGVWKYYVRFRSGKPAIKPGEALNCIATVNGILYQYTRDEIANLILNENSMGVFDVLIININDATKYCIYSNAENAKIRL